ncbi:MAG: archaeosortase A [Candidatus Thermoplasmatota archaeon]
MDDERAPPEGPTPEPGAPQPVRPDSPAVAPAADAVEPRADQPPRKDRLFGRVRKPRRARLHPYRDELSPDAERGLDARRVTLAWAAVALLLVGGGYAFASRYSPHVPGASAAVDPATWNVILQVPLFTGIALLAASFSHGPTARRLTQAGWLVGALYGGLWAQDLFYENAADYVNAAFSVVFGVLFVYLAYHEWLSRMRGVENAAVRFLGISWFVGAGAYFLIDKVQPVRLWLIHVVSGHTKWMLDLFGQGDKAGIVFLVNETDNKSPTTFFYPDQYCDPYNPAIPDVSAYCAEHGLNVPSHTPVIGDSWLQELLFIAPDGDLYIKPVSIILACTALQSIMVFVGLFAGTVASWQKKVRASLLVGAVIYVLNLVRNTGIIWFYGQGHASFWVMHDAIGKGGSLAAMILIAFGVFRWFPEFFTALTGVLDLVDRDGPIERALKVGKRRPDATAATVPTPT